MKLDFSVKGRGLEGKILRKGRGGTEEYRRAEAPNKCAPNKYGQEGKRFGSSSYTG